MAIPLGEFCDFQYNESIELPLFDGSGQGRPPSDIIPGGTVLCRIRQLHGDIPRDHRPPNHPLHERDRGNVLIR